MTVLLNYHIRRVVLGSMCVGDLVRLSLSGVRVAGFSLCVCAVRCVECDPHSAHLTAHTLYV